MKQLVQKHTISFKNAFAGLTWALETQPNYKIHLFLSVISIFAGVFFKIAFFEWLILLILITLGLVIETVNTTIEVAADAIDRSWNEDIKHMKDVSAASMLLFAMGAFIIAVIIFVPKILARLS